MAKNRLEDLGNHLFEQLERLKATDKPAEIDRAMAVANVATAIINSAKVELHFIEVMDRQGESAFWTPTKENAIETAARPALPSAPSPPATPPPAQADP